jgi:alpha-galactosidase
MKSTSRWFHFCLGRMILIFFLIPVLSIAAADGEKSILTPPTPPRPRINGPKIFGVRPNAPFLYAIPATGDRPMEFFTEGLPPGLTLDSKTGRISGTIRKRGEHCVMLRVRNALGVAGRPFRIVVGDRIALTPPMGWSSWYMAYADISDQMIRNQAEAMIRSGLADHGYSYVNIDDGWNIKLNSDDPLIGGAPRDGRENLKANRNFPNMKGMCDHVHGLGLKIGIYISPGPSTCAGFAGSYGHEEQDARQFAEWGFDFLKYDWCGYRSIARDKSRAELQKPYLVMRKALGKVGRDLVYNLCQYGMGDVWEWGREVGGNYWRTSGDLGVQNRTLWENMSEIGFSQAGKEAFAGPGGWNDPDNILIGHILWRNKLIPSPLTPDEQYTYVSLWSLLAAPLIFGGDMTRLDPFTLSLLTNDEVIDINQDALGRQGAPVSRSGGLEVWAKDLEDGSTAVGLFNRSEAESTVKARWADLKIKGIHRIRDLWRQKDLGYYKVQFSAPIPRHGVLLLRLFPRARSLKGDRLKRRGI